MERALFSSSLVFLLVVGCAGNPASAPGPAAPSPPPAAATAAAMPRPSDPLALPASITDLALPSSSATTRAAAVGSLPVYVGKRDLAMGAPPRVVVPLPKDGPRDHGFDGAFKRSGPNDLFVTPIHDAVPKGAKSALVYLDKDTAYRTLVEVLFTLGQSEITHFDFVVKGAGGALATLGVDPPRACGPGSSPCPGSGMATTKLGALILVVPDGLSVKARGGNVAPGCNDVGPGLAIPAAGGAQDFGALGACLAKIKRMLPEYESERSITVSASPGIPVQAVFGAMDAARGPSDAPLFPDVSFGISR